MFLTVLGSGTSVPHPRRSSSAYWLETASGTVLLDCSPSAIQQMAELRLDWAGLDAIWISHFHLDHFGGLAPYLFGIKHAAETRGRTSPLRIFGGRGLDALIRDIDAAGGYRLLEQRFAIEIVEVGKQLLMTRGSLTTFSIANDVAKYFAIIPAMFSGVLPALDRLNVMDLHSPRSAILSAVIFNALVIIGLVPLGLKGVKFRAEAASAVLRRNLLVYGLGGMLVPFVGIKLIDVVVAALGAPGRHVRRVRRVPVLDAPHVPPPPRAPAGRPR